MRFIDDYMHYGHFIMSQIGMRLLPVVPFIMRVATADTQISNCTIPKDAFILMSIFNLHRVSKIVIDYIIILELKFVDLSLKSYSKYSSGVIFGVKMRTNLIQIIFWQKMSVNDIHSLFFHFRLDHAIA